MKQMALDRWGSKQIILNEFNLNERRCCICHEDAPYVAAGKDYCGKCAPSWLIKAGQLQRKESCEVTYPDPKCGECLETSDCYYKWSQQQKREEHSRVIKQRYSGKKYGDWIR